jgi:molybdate transport system regulatory protein
MAFSSMAGHGIVITRIKLRFTKQGAAMQPKLKVWVVFDDGVKFGQGRAALLRLIDELGSIKQAVDRFEMSYRNAWGYLRDLERAAGFRLLERQPGGSRASGTRLTPKGREFLDRYEQFERSLEKSVARCFHQTFSPLAGVKHGTWRGADRGAARVQGSRKSPSKTT